MVSQYWLEWSVRAAVYGKPVLARMVRPYTAGMVARYKGCMVAAAEKIAISCLDKSQLMVDNGIPA
jgi:hypothetical protein